MIIDEIKLANQQAMKNRDENAHIIYSVLMNKHLMLKVDMRKQNKEPQDADMLNLIQKTIKELEEELALFAKAKREEEVKNLNEQKALIEKFLPSQMTAEEIKAEILKLEDKSMPSVMKHFKMNFSGKCDMRMVQEVLKSL